MPIYSVYEPPGKAGHDLHNIDRVQFVRDGFHVIAFAAPLLWFLWHRAWLGASIMIAIMVALSVGERWFDVWLLSTIGIIIGVAVGIFAPLIRHKSLLLKGYRDAGIVAGADRFSCESRYFERRLNALDEKNGPFNPSPPPKTMPSPARTSEREVLGLFPDRNTARQ